MKNKIRKYRTQKGLTEVQLSDMLGISVRTLQRYQNGGLMNDMWELLLKLSGIFDVSIEDLFESDEAEDDRALADKEEEYER
ncbi:helix-turn-helix transcriptional regulator [Bacilliculturomica massiliensis]|uniref:helix-turn-helix transcriptional regulator n=1 Tax=Bacilliculturomica massiliensis TaxID=1917867 RepID=UPI0013EF55FD|nr:helix-turn-helix transcriptional regulator [Bacilliculturomica massiliensis]